MVTTSGSSSEDIAEGLVLQDEVMSAHQLSIQGLQPCSLQVPAALQSCVVAVQGQL